MSNRKSRLRTLACCEEKRDTWQLGRNYRKLVINLRSCDFIHPDPALGCRYSMWSIAAAVLLPATQFLIFYLLMLEHELQKIVGNEEITIVYR